MSVDRFSWVPNSYRLHFLLEKQWTTHVPTGPGELVQVWYTNGPMGGPQMPQVKWLWCRETMHSSVLQRGCRFSSERAGFALPGWTWNRDGIVLKVPKHTQKLDTPWYTKNLMHGSSFFQSKMAMFFPCLRQNQMRRCTPLHSVALRCTPSHSVAPRRTPSHPVARRRTPSHAVAPRRTFLHSVAPRCTFLHSVALRCTPLHSVALRCTPLHPVAPRCTPLHPVALRCTLLRHEATWDTPCSQCP